MQPNCPFPLSKWANWRNLSHSTISTKPILLKKWAFFYIIWGICTWIGRFLETAILNKQRPRIFPMRYFKYPLLPNFSSLQKEFFPTNFILYKEYCTMVEKHCPQRREWWSLEFKTKESLQNDINYNIKSNVTNNTHPYKNALLGNFAG